MDKAYEGEEVRSAAVFKGLLPVVPPKSNRKEPWAYDKILYKRREAFAQKNPTHPARNAKASD